MNDLTDAQLLQAYAERRSEPAFAELVRRHIDLVHSAALRMVCDAHLAKDVTQAVFVALAKNAAELADRSVLSGWLHRVAQNIAAQTVRTDVRRRAREQEAAAMNKLLATGSDADWEDIAPHLDAALSELSEPDRDAVLLRYFERKSAREMAVQLGISDDAAQKRVNRAVERLRELFAKRGITVGAGGLTVVISANAVQAAPVGLAVAISTTAALTGTTLATTATVTATKTIAMTALQKTIVTATIAVLAGVGIYEARQAAQLRAQVQTLQQQQAPLLEQIEQLRTEREASAQRLTALSDENERLNQNSAELLRLRGLVGQLRGDSQELDKLKASISADQSSAEAWLARVNLIKRRLEQAPEARIPELRYVNEYDWLQAARNPLNTESDYRKALSLLRTAGESRFAEQASMALNKFLKANANEFPAQLSQLSPYFSPFFQPPVDEAILKRWEIVPTTNGGAGFGGDWVITQKAPVDEDYDMRRWIGPDGQGGVGTGSFKLPQVKEVTANTNIVREATIDPNDALAVLPALRAYAAEHDGRQVTNASQLLPYLTKPEQKAALLRLGGEMGLVGVVLAPGKNNLPKIQKVLPGLPAETAGVQVGASILSIDGVNLVGKSVAEVVRMIQGPADTSVLMELMDPTTGKTTSILVPRVKR